MLLCCSDGLEVSEKGVHITVVRVHPFCAQSRVRVRREDGTVERSFGLHRASWCHVLRYWPTLEFWSEVTVIKLLLMNAMGVDREEKHREPCNFLLNLWWQVWNEVANDGEI